VVTQLVYQGRVWDEIELAEHLRDVGMSDREIMEILRDSIPYQPSGAAYAEIVDQLNDVRDSAERLEAGLPPTDQKLPQDRLYDLVMSTGYDVSQIDYIAKNYVFADNPQMWEKIKTSFNAWHTGDYPVYIPGIYHLPGTKTGEQDKKVPRFPVGLTKISSAKWAIIAIIAVIAVTVGIGVAATR
jgi:hypothetical protein